MSKQATMIRQLFRDHDFVAHLIEAWYPGGGKQWWRDGRPPVPKELIRMAKRIPKHVGPSRILPQETESEV